MNHIEDDINRLLNNVSRNSNSAYGVAREGEYIREEIEQKEEKNKIIKNQLFEIQETNKKLERQIFLFKEESKSNRRRSNISLVIAIASLVVAIITVAVSIIF